MKKTLNETIRLRVPCGYKGRGVRVARRRLCSLSDIAREGLIARIEAEELRLGIKGK